MGIISYPACVVHVKSLNILLMGKGRVDTLMDYYFRGEKLFIEK
jgi:hypothetical protein